uniref:Uncharacterized protein n=1 Tax=Octopus bimaculoides TaxID=37653 RepID=A0A0L8GNT7_OCTBM
MEVLEERRRTSSNVLIKKIYQQKILRTILQRTGVFFSAEDNEGVSSGNKWHVLADYFRKHFLF